MELKEYEIMKHFIEPSDFTDYSATFCQKEFSADNDEEAIKIAEEWMGTQVIASPGSTTIWLQKKSGKEIYAPTARPRGINLYFVFARTECKVATFHSAPR